MHDALLHSAPFFVIIYYSPGMRRPAIEPSNRTTCPRGVKTLNNKIKRFIEPSMKMYLVVLVLFTIAALFFNKYLAFAYAIAVVLLVIYSLIISRRKRRELMEYIDSVTYNVETAKSDTLLNFPLPMVVFKLDDGQIIWGNTSFFNICGGKPPLDARMTDLIPSFSGKWIYEGKSQAPGLTEIGERKYQIYGNIVRSPDKARKTDFMGIAYWLDVTDFDNIKQEYAASRPVVSIIVLDNYDELTKSLPERTRTTLLGDVDDRITQWAESKGGFLNRIDRDRYVFIFEERWLPGFIEEKFSLIDKVHEVVSPSGIHATVSIGIGRDGGSFEENNSFAALSIEMALSRGGDQAVIKNRFNFEFYGGRGNEVETRTKVKSRVMANALSELIADASRVYVMGHKFADLDCVGAAAGLGCIARKRGTPLFFVTDPENNASHELITRIKQQPEYQNAFITPQDAILMADNRSLLIVVDTNRPEQVEDENLLLACNRVAVIDHHRRTSTFIQNPTLSFVEPYASSVCELITELMQELTEQSDILRCEAEAMLAGIVLDTKNFTLRTGERTFDAAAFLRRVGADTTEVKRFLQVDFESTVARCRILQGARLYRDGIAVAVLETEQDRVVVAQAADELVNIARVKASIVMYSTASGGVIMSARSISDINVQMILEKLGGGGNKSSAGVQLANISLRDAVNQLFRAIDEYLDA